MQRELRDGLILRTLSEGHASDRERLPIFYKETFAEAGDEEADTFDVWLDDLINKHPNMSLDDFFCVVDPAADDKIVSATLLIPQVWRYEDIEIPMGRPELVATDKAYRRRGLVRALMNSVHERSEALGHLLQGITGIEYYYRQFGYAMAVDLGFGAIVPITSIKTRKEDEKPDYTLREATEADIPDLIALEASAGREGVLSTVWDEAMWRYDLLERSEGTAVSYRKYMVVDNEGQAVGYVSLMSVPDEGKYQPLNRYVIGDKASYLATFDDVLRGIATIAQQSSGQVQTITFSSNISPALAQMIEYTFGAQVRSRRYTWYLRVPDQAKFFQAIAPVLERRLQGSVAHGYTGHFKVGFHNFKYLDLQFEHGKLIDAQNREMTDEEVRVDAQFPFHMWYNIVFGHRSYTDLNTILPDAEAGRLGAILCDTLFPKRPQSLMQIE